MLPRMPEIVGEPQDAEPARGEGATVETARPIEASSRRSTARPRERGMTISPLRLRLNDFSGEGERAPPRVSRPGSGTEGIHRAEAPI